MSSEHPDTAFQNCCFFVYRLVRNGDRRYYHNSIAISLRNKFKVAIIKKTFDFVITLLQ